MTPNALLKNPLFYTPNKPSSCALVKNPRKEEEATFYPPELPSTLHPPTKEIFIGFSNNGLII
jgi:hypothetical protein